jgi:HSP20 family molecular chaperone IbpA
MRMKRQVRAQLRSDSARTSKVIKDREAIEAVVEVAGAGKLVLRVDSAGGFSLRGRPEGEEGKEDEEAARQVLLAVGVMRADEIVAVRPEEGPP